MIENRIVGQHDQHQPPEQAGFCPGYSTTDHLHTLNQVIEKFKEFNKPLHLGFVDYSKAFESLQRTAIETALHNQFIQRTLIY